MMYEELVKRLRDAAPGAAKGENRMSVLIPGMEMPKGCASCKISRRNGKKMICPFIWKCEWDIHDPMSADHRLDGCPLVPVPNHGRLIDADALIADCQLAQKQADRHGREYANAFYSGGGEVSTEWWCVEDMIENAPTIIPAEEGEG